MNEIQKIELDILKEIDRVCRENQISFQLSGGSMLGAVRHNGFIPWDDDIDINMLRSDYEHFLTIAEKKLRYPYRLCTYHNTENHHYYFSHVVDMRYAVRRLGSMDQRVENVWVDVYPLDGMPNSRLLREIHYMKLNVFRFFYHIGYFDRVNIARPGRPFYQKILIHILLRSHKALRFDGESWREKIDCSLKKYTTDSSACLFNFIGMQGRKEIFPGDIFRVLRKYKFEDMEVKGPADANAYLSQLYGDWEKLPDKESRNIHPMEILFDESGDCVHKAVKRGV